MKVKAAVCYEYKTPLVIEELDLAEPRMEEVMIRMVGTGVCPTDSHAQEHGWHGWNKMPMVFGHEGSGVVEKVGPGVTEFKEGDHVIVSYPYCGKCEYCLTGRPYYCPECIGMIHGGSMADGFRPFSKNGKPINNFFGASTFTTHTVSNARNLAKVDPDLDLLPLGPLACGFLTGAGTVLNEFKPLPGSRIAVFGIGGVGLSALMAAKVFNCGTIIGIDIVESRLELAKELGATHVINSKEVGDVQQAIMDITGGQGVQYVVETTAAAPVVKTALSSLGIDGVLAMVGTPTKYEFDNLFFELYGKRIVAINMGQSHPKITIPQLVDWFKRGIYPIEKLVKYYPFEEINQAMADSKSGKTIKPVIKF